MLAIRLQRHGRKGYATYRFVVQDAHRSPTSGRVVAQIGHYNPHTKDIQVEKDKAEFYLGNGAQPSERVARIFKDQKIKLPAWVKEPLKQEGSIRNPDKLRKNQPKEEKPANEPKAEEKPAEEQPAEAAKPEEKAEAPTDKEQENEPSTEGTSEDVSADKEKSDAK